uniref:Uncharacterized protein n=1 Tax=Arundo donax TaxID=35708 RepID=A0A0A9C025_ARUDO
MSNWKRRLLWTILNIVTQDTRDLHVQQKYLPYSLNVSM